MKGQVLDYSVQKNEGVISAADGSRHTFTGSEWKGETPPVRGMAVDFESDQNVASGVYRALTSGAGSDIYKALTSGSGVKRDPKSKAAATLWAIFLGGFGAHKFYMGSWGWGIVYLLTCWLYIPFLITLVEWIRYVLMSDDEFYAKAAEFQNRNSGPFSFFW